MDTSCPGGCTAGLALGSVGVTRGGLTRLWPVSADAAVQAKCVAVKGRMLVHLEMCRERVRTLNSEGWAGL